MHSSILGIWVSITLAGFARAHAAPFHPSSWCFNGTDPSIVNWNANAPVVPLYNLTHKGYWIHGLDNCNQFPPSPGDFLEIPSGGKFTVEIAENRAFTTYGRGPISDWGDGQNHPDDYHSPTCIKQPNLHTQNQSMAAGTAFGIAYKSNLDEIALEDVVIFTVAYYTPWKRITEYHVPPGMPKCPDGGCICIYLWIPNGCGQPNIYIMPYRCQVIPDSTPPRTIGTPRVPVWCEEDPSQCVKGPKYPMIWNQLEGNNIIVSGRDLSGGNKSPAYNAKCGFADGAQMDIFVDGDTNSSTPTSTPVLASGPGTSTLPASQPTSNVTTGSGTSTLPYSVPPSNTPTGTPAGTPTGTLTGTLTGTPTGTLTGTPTWPTSIPPSNPAGSGTPSGGTCNSGPHESASGHQKMRRARHNIF